MSLSLLVCRAAKLVGLNVLQLMTEVRNTTDTSHASVH